LNKSEIDNNLLNLSGWRTDYQNIEREFQLKDFSEAISFVVNISFIAEKKDHHPDILIHSWNKVKIKLSTHSEKGITEQDFELAEEIEKIYIRY